MRVQVFFKHRAILVIFAALVAFGCSSSPEAKSAKSIEAGKKLLQRNDPSRAILQFRNAVQATPKNAEAFYQLSLAYLQAGDVRMGITTLRKTLELDPKHKDAQLRMARIMAMASDSTYVEEAQQRLVGMLAENPGSADTLHALAFTELKLGKTENGLEHLRRAVALAPNDLTINLSLAYAKLQQNDVQGAEEILRKLAQNSPKSTDAATILGGFFRSQNRWAEAEQEFQRALSLAPDNANALFELANVQNTQGRMADAEQTYKRLSALPGKTYKPLHAMFLWQENRRDEAVREFEALAKQDLEDREARTRLIAVYRMTGRGAAAEKLLDEALKKNSNDADALLQRAETLIASAKYDRAQEDLNRVLRLHPDSPQVHYGLAKLHQGRGESAIYRQELQKALELDPNLLPVRLEAVQNLLATKDARGAVALLDQAPGSTKDRPEVVAQRNWALLALGDAASMRKGIDRGLSLGRTPEFLLQDAIWNLNAGKSAAARTALEELLRINPGDVRALAALNQSYMAQKQSDLGLEKVREYATRALKDAAAQEFVGSLLLAKGRLPEARQAFDSAKAADPKYLLVEFDLAQVDMLDGRPEDAQRRLEAVLAANPSNQTAMLWLGNLEVRRGNHKSALQHFRRAVEIDPNSAQVLNNYAYALSEFGNDPVEALKYAQKAKELSPGDAAYGDTLGWILYRKGLYPNAVSELERATAKGGEPVWAYHLAMAYAKAGDVARGRATLERALKLNPNLPEAIMAKEVLEKTKN